MDEWHYLHAFVQGKGHIEENMPCQDYCNVFQHKNYTICIVSDGAGSCEKSDIGSYNAAISANIHFSKLIQEKKWHNQRIKIKLEDWKRLCIKGFKAIRNDLECVCLSENCSLKSLSCTLIIAIHFKDKLLITHIGDGRAGYCDFEDEWNAMMKPHRGKYSNETVFITSDIWHDEVILNNYIECKIITKKIKAFCLLTDGCENASFECYKMNENTSLPEDINKPYKDFFHENINIHIPNLLKAGKLPTELNDIWKSFLQNGNDTLKKESDDKSMILAIKVPLQV